MKPCIGIIPDINRNEDRIELSKDYYNCIIEYGGIPFVIPIDSSDLYKEYFNIIDGLLLTGGDDINPLLFGETMYINSGFISPKRDYIEYNMGRYAIERDIPILGICKGMQMLAICSGGGIYQDVYSQIDRPIMKHKQDAPRWFPSHSIKINKNTILYDIIKVEDILVNSFHHQAVRNLGKDFVVSATSPDGIIEAIEHKGNRFSIGIQWHPECMKSDENQMNIFKRFMSVAKDYKENKCQFGN